MAVIAMASADLDDLSMFTDINRFAISALQARTGSYSYETQANAGAYFNIDLPDSSEIYLRFAVRNAGTALNVYFMQGTSLQCTVSVTTGLVAAYYRTSTTLLGSSQIATPINTWAVYEIYVKIHGSAGVITIKKDGVQVVHATGQTSYTSATLSAIKFYNTESCLHYYDDILVDDASWPGLGGIEVVKPSADGTDLAWTSGSYLDVIDDDDATYVATDAEVTAKQSFAIPALAADRKTPTAVGLFTKSQLSGAGAGTLRPYLDANQGASLALSTSLQYTRDYQVAYPSEVGLEVVV